MTTSDLDIIPSHFLEDLKTKYMRPIEIHGVESCEDFIYYYYGPDTMQAYREMDRVSREIFWGYCLLYIKGGCYCSIRKDICHFPSLPNGDKWYQSKDGSAAVSHKLNPTLWDLIILSIAKVKATLGASSLKSSVKPISMSSVRSKELPSWAKDPRDVSEELHRLHEGMSPVNKDKIDLPILYINMDSSTDRRKFIEEQTRGLSKPVVRITGVLVTDEMLALYTQGSKRGAVGCFLAHRNAMKELLKKGWDKALILEDDGCLHMSSRWPKKLSELEAPSWLSQGTTAYIITPSIARDFLERTEGLTDLTRGVDILLMMIYGNNRLNEWSDYSPGNWRIYPYVYPAAHLFETQIQGLSKQKYLNDCERSVRIIKTLGGGLKIITLHRNKKNVNKSGFQITNIVAHTPISRSQALNLRYSKEGLLEIYTPVLSKGVFEGIKNVRIFEIPYTNLEENSINTLIYSHDNQLPETSFHIVVVCTPNYDNIGQYGISMLSKYCKMHGYELSVVRDAIKDLHVNFTKNSAAISVLKSTKVDYVVNIDADVIVKDFSVGLANIIVDPNAVMQAPEDYWGNGGTSQHNTINAGCVFWKNCSRAIRINEIWLDKARGECYHEATNTFSLQQNTFDKCVIQEIKEGELAYIDHNLVGLPHSSVIAQADGNTDVPELQCSECRGNTKDTSKVQCKKCKEKIVYLGWLQAGSPPLQPASFPIVKSYIDNLDEVEGSV
ncbi:MAG: glycosyltransferase family 25 protein [bacterium]|nr:glycosyltransferase family 25 protein [bacterium]